MNRAWRGSASSSPETFIGVKGAAVGGDRLHLEEGEARLRVGDQVFPIPRDDVAKVYVCRGAPWEYGLCFEMKDARDYEFWGWWRLRGAEEAWHAVKKARYPVTRTIYRSGRGRLARHLACRRPSGPDLDVWRQLRSGTSLDLTAVA